MILSRRGGVGIVQSDNRHTDENSAQRLTARSLDNALPRFRQPNRTELPSDSDRSHSIFAPLQDRRSFHWQVIKKRISAIVQVTLYWTASAWRFMAYRHSGSPTEAGVGLSVRLGLALDREVRGGLRLLALGLGIAGAWTVFFPLSAAVVAAGTLVVQSSVKKVQHPTGGVIAQILVRDGSHVEQGDLLVRLDDTQTRAKLQVIAQQLDEVRARIARLNAERDGKDELQFPIELTRRRVAPEVERLLASEHSLFLARANARKGQKDLIRNRVNQLGEEVAGLEAQIQSKAAQINLVTTELQGVQSLYDKQLVPLTRLNSLQRESAHLEGDRAQLSSSVAETKSKISEAELQAIQIDQDLRTEVMKDLREISGQGSRTYGAAGFRAGSVEPDRYSRADGGCCQPAICSYDRGSYFARGSHHGNRARF